MELVFILLIIILCFGVSLLFLRKWLKEGSQTDPLVVEWLKSSSGQINQRLDAATQMMAYLQKNLGEMAELGKGVKEFQEFIQSPKLRGGVGEQILADMLRQVLPEDLFKIQYTFKSGDRVDAVIITSAGLLCIDSKFPMSNYKLMYSTPSEIGREQARKSFSLDVKKHISSISDKYLNPAENTVDVAFMYIPSEAVFYEIASSSELVNYASEKRVVPVSPATLYAYLKGVLMAYQSKQLQEKSFEILKLIKAVNKDYSLIEESLGILGRHITNAYNQMSNVTMGVSSLGNKLDQAQSISIGESKKQVTNK
jgi:DNA recombination protein RmuC